MNKPSSEIIDDIACDIIDFTNSILPLLYKKYREDWKSWCPILTRCFLSDDTTGLAFVVQVNINAYMDKPWNRIEFIKNMIRIAMMILEALVTRIEQEIAFEDVTDSCTICFDTKHTRLNGIVYIESTVYCSFRRNTEMVLVG